MKIASRKIGIVNYIYNRKHRDLFSRPLKEKIDKDELIARELIIPYDMYGDQAESGHEWLDVESILYANSRHVVELAK